MDKIERSAQEEMDRHILAFVRGLAPLAPVTLESALAYLQNHARLRVTQRQTFDRLAYLVSAGCLVAKTEWDGGEVTHYTITAKGMDILDGNIAPLNWKAP